MKLHILQHVPFEGPGYIASWAAQNGHTITYTRFYEEDHRFPETDQLDALIIMGGPMDVFDEHIYAWLHPEKVFIEDCILAGKKVLGICLGAQLAAQCVGATVTTAKNKEIGWYPVETTEMSAVLPWFAELFSNKPTVLHWHGDKFQIPYGGFELLRSAGNINQAFIYTGNVLGLQFHLEATNESIDQMITHCGHELNAAEFVQSADQLLAGKVNIPENQRIMATMLHRFLEE